MPTLYQLETKTMKFTYKGKDYVIEFQRRNKHVTRYRPDGTQFYLESKYPSTIARLVEIDPAKPLAEKIFREASVGCWHQEPQFSLEKGRIRALRMITMTIDKDMKPLMWDAYHNRVATIKVDRLASMKQPSSMVKD